MADEALRRSDDVALSELIESRGDGAGAADVGVLRACRASTCSICSTSCARCCRPEVVEARARRRPSRRCAARTPTRVRPRPGSEPCRDADAVLADARHNAEQLVTDAESAGAREHRRGGPRIEHARLITATTVHQAAALRGDARCARTPSATRRRSQCRGAAVRQRTSGPRPTAIRPRRPRRGRAVRHEAHRRRRGLRRAHPRRPRRDPAPLRRSTAEQGRSAALAERRATAWTSQGPVFDRGTPDQAAYADHAAYRFNGDPGSVGSPLGRPRIGRSGADLGREPYRVSATLNSGLDRPSHVVAREIVCPENTTPMPQTPTSHADPRSPFVFDLRELGRRAGGAASSTGAAFPRLQGLGLDVISVAARRPARPGSPARIGHRGRARHGHGRGAAHRTVRAVPRPDRRRTRRRRL